jgi:hypothetical protein
MAVRGQHSEPSGVDVSMGHRRIGLTAVAIVLGVAPPASAWSPEEPVGPRSGVVAFAGYQPDGTRVIGIERSDASGLDVPRADLSPVPKAVVIAAPGGAFGPAVALPDADPSGWAVDPSSRTMVTVGGPVNIVRKPTAPRPSVPLRVFAGAVGSPLAAVDARGITASVLLATATTESGDVAVLLSQTKRVRGRQLADTMLAVRPAGGAFAAPIRLTNGRGTTTGALTINGEGDILAVWGQTGPHGEQLKARLLPKGRPPLTTRTLASKVITPHVVATLTSARCGVIAWSTLHPAPLTSPGVTLSARRLDTGGRLGPTVRVDDTHVVDQHSFPTEDAGLHAFLGSDDHTMLVWTTDIGHRTALRNQRVGGITHTLPLQSYALLDTVASDPAGDAIAVWSGNGSLGTAIRRGNHGRFALTGVAIASPDSNAAAAIAPPDRALVAVMGGPGLLGGAGGQTTFSQLP